MPGAQRRRSDRRAGLALLRGRWLSLRHVTQGWGRHSPLPMEGASPFMNCGKGLPDAGTSKEAPALPPSRSILPACSRSLSRSCDSRRNCSLCVRHFSSSSRTLLCTAEARTRSQGWGGHACMGVHTRVCVYTHAHACVAASRLPPPWENGV